MTDKSLPQVAKRVTHGRHCPCSACAREDWTKITGPCGMHGAECPAVYDPLPQVAEGRERRFAAVAYTLRSQGLLGTLKDVELIIEQLTKERETDALEMRGQHELTKYWQARAEQAQAQVEKLEHAGLVLVFHGVKETKLTEIAKSKVLPVSEALEGNRIWKGDIPEGAVIVTLSSAALSEQTKGAE